MSSFDSVRDGHGRFALAVDLRQPRPEAVERGERVLDIHRRAAPDQRADIAGVAIGRTGDQPLDHGRRREHRAARPGREQLEDFLRLEAAALRRHLHAEPRDVRHDVDAGAVTHRRGMQDGVARRDRVDLGGIGMACPVEIAVREHGAFRPPGGARGVEQPSEVVAAARRHVGGVGGEQRLVVGAADGDQVLEAFGRVRRQSHRRDRARRNTRARRNAPECSRARHRAAWHWPAPPQDPACQMP